MDDDTPLTICLQLFMRANAQEIKQICVQGKRYASDALGREFQMDFDQFVESLHALASWHVYSRDQLENPHAFKD